MGMIWQTPHLPVPMAHRATGHFWNWTHRNINPWIRQHLMSKATTWISPVKINPQQMTGDTFLLVFWYMDILISLPVSFHFFGPLAMDQYLMESHPKKNK